MKVGQDLQDFCKSDLLKDLLQLEIKHCTILEIAMAHYYGVSPQNKKS